jgi:CRISPR-associated protein Cas2
MHYIAVYDITSDTLRNKVSSRMKDYGLERIQYSTFEGPLSRYSLRSLHTDMRKLLNEGEETDSVIIFPLCNSCFSNRVLIGAQKEMERSETEVSVF